MDDTDVMEVDNMQCDVCGELKFQEREGYYYCIECGTKKEQLRAVEINAEDTFNDTKNLTTVRTIKQPKAISEDNEITSWEFYNYVLRGFVQDLLNIGAKPELKLMTLQVWAAYMGRMEVAFCKNNVMGLPKLNVRSLPRDARIIYNHRQAKRKRERLDKRNLSHDDERSKWRQWRKTKRKLDATGCSKKDAPTESTAGHSIRLQWSWRARKTLKRHMPLKHLDKHSVDSTGSMRCHGLRPKAKNLGHFDRNIFLLNINKVYVVLAIALNMVGDDYQLTDLLRLIDEEHLTSRYILKYLPEDVALRGKTLIKELQVGHQTDKCSYDFLRRQVGYMSRFIDLTEFLTPDLTALTQRYVEELSLPPAVADYVCRLMDVYPPEFKHLWDTWTYPRYEARVMAYIVYAMKLLFGLDDIKEKKISESAAEVNECLEKLQKDHKDEKAPAKLFVFGEWMQFVELRKVLVSHYNQSFAQRFGVATHLERQLDDILIKERKQEEHDNNFNEVEMTPAMRQSENMRHTFECRLKENYGEGSAEMTAKDHIEFQPSLKPACSYFSRLLQHASRPEGEDMSVQIPDYMRVQHSERQLDPFIAKTTALADYLGKYDVKLCVQEVSCQKNYQKVGIFQYYAKQDQKCTEFRANCDVQGDEWIEGLRKKEKRPIFKFRQPVATYGRQYKLKMEERAARRTKMEANNPFWKIQETPNYRLKLNDEELSLDDLSSLQAFDEAHMQPLSFPLDMPRRLINSRRTLTDAEMIAPKEEADEEREVQGNTQLLNVSSFDIWLLHGHMNKLPQTYQRELRTLFPCSFRWLLETCAATIGVCWSVLYEQLLVLEVVFHHGIEDWSTHKDHLRLKYNNTNKDINMMTKIYRDMW
ncbi:LOW QUALITY PROTEIN: TATA box-binding protein-associated factor RNA polymerase I subunit B [Drosophila obscura]|uniref:LOW QUALITY PROTEIN: TATA box-binding protein-associated factor RNA polymerase I subunit B n=1 Tax=Drosophila obscura TaxID=7282 RepID=UPI001BB0F4A0|nr:LOW QUALITY PROTEIN: TATA box-binding protein-associated factor RNA polymerase I subunit B [Drosophila obscura]